MLSIKKVELKNIQKHKNLILDFYGDTNAHLFIGKNGDGKTAALRSIVIGLSDFSDGHKLLGKMRGHIISTGQKEGIIKIDLMDKESMDIYSIKTVISWDDKFERISQTFKKNENDIERSFFPWEKVFVVAYGAVDRTLATKDYREYSTVDAVDCLFDYSSSLQNPELTIRRLCPNGTIPLSIQNDLKKILGLEEKSKIRLTKEGLFISNGEKKEKDFRDAGDGYQSTLTWILDLFYWWILKRKSSLSTKRVDLGEVEGIVLVDEIENHLHPEWEKKIISSLASSFPKVQFIISTHSPLVVSGFDSNVYNLHDNNEEVSPFTAYGWPAEYVFKDIMGLKNGSRAEEISNAIDRYDDLFSKILNEEGSKEEKEEMGQLEEFIAKRTPGDDASLLLNKIDSLKNFLLKPKK